MKLFLLTNAGALVTAAAAARSTYTMDLWSQYDFQGTQAKFESPGIHRVSWSGGAKSWIWQSESGDGCCAVFCRGSTNVGKYCGSAEKAESSAGTNKVVIGCGDVTLNC